MIPGKSRAAMPGRHVLCLDQVLDAYRHTVNGRDRAPPAIPLGRPSRAPDGLRTTQAFTTVSAIGDYRKTALEIGPRRVAPVAESRHHIKKGQWVKTFWREGHSIFPEFGPLLTAISVEVWRVRVFAAGTNQVDYSETPPSIATSATVM